jgi:hypothetical protein
MGNWKWSNPESNLIAARGEYEKSLKEYLIQETIFGILSLRAPGSGQQVSTESSLDCLKKVMNFIAM